MTKGDSYTKEITELVVKKEDVVVPSNRPGTIFNTVLHSNKFPKQNASNNDLLMHLAVISLLRTEKMKIYENAQKTNSTEFTH